MNKLEANISLALITFFSSIQYAFLAGVPDSVSHFAFLCVTNLVGFIIMLLFFFRELFRLDAKQIVQSLILSAELVGFNIFMLLGSRDVGATVSACVLSAYFIFIPILSYPIFKVKPDKRSFPGIAVVLVGLFLMMNCDVAGLLRKGILYLLLADIFFAVYTMTLGDYSKTSNPSIIAMGQMFFSFLISLFFWAGQAGITGDVPLSLPSDPAFWGSVIYISFFIRGLFGIVQIYAMRYVSPLNTALVFSTEIIMTMAMSPVLTRLFGMAPEEITGLRIAGGAVMVAGVLLADSTVFELFKKKLSDLRKPANVARQLLLLLVSAAVYFCFDLVVQASGFLQFGSMVGLKNFLPSLLGLFWGPITAVGTCLGCVGAGLILGTEPTVLLTECLCNLIVGIGMWSGWHFFSKSHRLFLSKPRHFLRYNLLLLAVSVLCGLVSWMILGPEAAVRAALAYFFVGVIAGEPIFILFSNILRVECVIPSRYVSAPDSEFTLTADPGTLITANELIEDASAERGIGMKRTFELENCLEEMSIRIFRTLPEAEIGAKLLYGDTISLRVEYKGENYNPFLLAPGEDALDMAGLSLLRHRALRVSHSYSGGVNHIHIVI